MSRLRGGSLIFWLNVEKLMKNILNRQKTLQKNTYNTNFNRFETNYSIKIDLKRKKSVIS